MKEKAKEKKPNVPEDKKTPGHIHLIPMPSDQQTLEEEMLEAFQEDQVRHKHGNAEPERD